MREVDFRTGLERAVPGLAPESLQLIHSVFESAEFADLACLLRATFERYHFRWTMRDVDTQFVGSFFELIAYEFLKSQLAPSEKVLSPAQTFDLFRLLYPDRGVIDHYGFGPILRGVPVPDGLVFSSNGNGQFLLTGACEYKIEAARVYEKYRGQFDSRPDIYERTFLWNRPARNTTETYLKQVLPGLTGYMRVDRENFRVVHVAPSNYSTGLFGDPGNNKIQLLQVPVDSGSFRRLVSRVVTLAVPMGHKNHV